MASIRRSNDGPRLEVEPSMGGASGGGDHGNGRAIHRADDGTETDITEGVQALYDLVISSMDWGSGFWTYEDALPVAQVGRHKQPALVVDLIKIHYVKCRGDGPWEASWCRQDRPSLDVRYPPPAEICQG